MTNNLNRQTVVNAVNTAVASGNVTAQAATLVPLYFTGGTFVCNGVSNVTVAEPMVTANSSIIVTLKTVGGTVGAVPAVKTITPGTGFDIAGTASDTSTYNYLVCQ